MKCCFDLQAQADAGCWKNIWSIYYGASIAKYMSQLELGIPSDGGCSSCETSPKSLPGQQWELSAKFVLSLPENLHAGSVLSGIFPPTFLLWFLLKRSQVTWLTGHVSSNSHILKSLLDVKGQQDPARTVTLYSPAAAGDGKTQPTFLHKHKQHEIWPNKVPSICTTQTPKAK